MTQSNITISFKVFRGTSFLREEVLEQAVIKIGNLASSHLRLADEGVSRMHSVIEVAAGRVTIIDLGSTAGTYVNGERLNKATLNSGDTIAIGELRIVVGFSVASESLEIASAPPSPITALPVFEPANDAQVTGEQSVEVTAMLGETVVGVKHVMNPRGGKVTKVTCGLLAFGAGLLLISAIAFSSGVTTAADNKARLHEHVAAQKVVHEFRPNRLGAAFDWMALGGLGGGLLCLTFGFLRLREEKVSPTYRIGNASGVDLPTQDAPQPDFSLVAPRGDGFVLNFANSWQGELRRYGQTSSLADLVSDGTARPSASVAGAMELDIHSGEEFHLATGDQSFVVRSVNKPRRQAVPLLASIDSNALSYVAATAVVIGGFMLVLDTLHEDEQRLYGDLFDNSDRYSLIQTTPFEDAIAEELEKEAIENDPGSTGTKMSDAEGLMGDKESKRPTGLFAMKQRDTTPAIAKEQALTQAREAGILGVMKSMEGGAFAELHAMNAFSSGLDDRDIYGGLLGSEVAAASGGWGFGTRGMGPGGGCEGCENWGTIGIGDYGVIGHGEGTGTKFGAGGGKGGMRGHKASVPFPKIGKLSKTGGIDADIIRRHIKRKLSRIRHCYEKELLVDSDLKGTVNTHFQISPNGKVQGVGAKGMGNKNVESCVAGVIKSIQFPSTPDGGYANVTRYPFMFRPAGG